VIAEDSEESLESPPFQHGVGEALVHLERLGQLFELLVREVRGGRLGDGDERDLVGNVQDWKAKPVCFFDHRPRNLGEAEADAEAEAGEAVLGEAADVRALVGCRLADAEAGREQELSALEKACRVFKLGPMQPAHVSPQSSRARRDGQLEAGRGRDVVDGKHGLFDGRAKPYGREVDNSRERSADFRFPMYRKAKYMAGGCCSPQRSARTREGVRVKPPLRGTIAFRSGV
jgi:hypothetical protein